MALDVLRIAGLGAMANTTHFYAATAYCAIWGDWTVHTRPPLVGWMLSLWAINWVIGSCLQRSPTERPSWVSFQGNEDRTRKQLPAEGESPEISHYCSFVPTVAAVSPPGDWTKGSPKSDGTLDGYSLGLSWTGCPCSLPQCIKRWIYPVDWRPKLPCTALSTLHDEGIQAGAAFCSRWSGLCPVAVRAPRTKQKSLPECLRSQRGYYQVVYLPQCGRIRRLQRATFVELQSLHARRRRFNPHHHPRLHPWQCEEQGQLPCSLWLCCPRCLG